MCLRDLVVFSSISNVRSVPGLTQYAYANSAMEAICEERRKDGLPAIAIQWAIVGDVSFYRSFVIESRVHILVV